MENLASVLIALIVILGCESTPKAPALKTLDWNKTASEQELKIGDTIIVEGLAYDIVEYYYTNRRIFPSLTDLPYFVVHVPCAMSKTWNEEISIPLYNPEKPDVKENPNVPIGSVVCVIFNPKYEEDLMALPEMYPRLIRQETPKEGFSPARARAALRSEFNSDYTGPITLLHIQHRFRFTGSIRGFSRKTLRSVSLPCIDIVVSGIEVISSEPLNELEEWRTKGFSRGDNVVYP